MPADKDGYVKAARDLLQMMEFTKATFVPLLDEMILPKLQAELVQQHLIIDLCLQHSEFPAELWCIVLQRLEVLVKKADPAALALTRKLFTAEMVRKAIENQPEAVGETLRFLRVTLDHWTTMATNGSPEAEGCRAQLVYCYSEAWEQVGAGSAAEKLRVPLSQEIANEISSVVCSVGGACLMDKQPVQLELLKAQLDALRPNVVRPDAMTSVAIGGVQPSKEQIEQQWRNTMVTDVARRDQFVATLNALSNEAEAESSGPTLVDLLLRELVLYCASEGATGAVRVDGARARLALVERMHRCCASISMGEAHLQTILGLLQGTDPPMEAMVYAWLRTAFSHAGAVKYDVEGQISHACFEPSAKQVMVAHLASLAQQDGGLREQAYFLFQNLLIDVNAASGAVHLRSFEGHTVAPHEFYTVSAARPAGIAATEISLREQTDRQANSSRIVAWSNAGEFNVYGQAKHRPKHLDGPRMVGSWLKIRQEDQNGSDEPTGVWKDGQLTRCIPGGWQKPARFDIVYVDGSHTNNSLRSLHSWFLLDPLEEQLPVIPDIYHVVRTQEVYQSPACIYTERSINHRHVYTLD